MFLVGKNEEHTEFLAFPLGKVSPAYWRVTDEGHPKKCHSVLSNSLINPNFRYFKKYFPFFHHISPFLPSYMV